MERRCPSPGSKLDQRFVPAYFVASLFAGSNKSNLIKRLEEGHGGTKLTPQEIRKVSLWIDLLVPQIGDYREANNWSDHDREFYDRYDKKRKQAAWRNRRIFASTFNLFKLNNRNNEKDIDTC